MDAFSDEAIASRVEEAGLSFGKDSPEESEIPEAEGDGSPVLDSGDDSELEDDGVDFEPEPEEPEPVLKFGTKENPLPHDKLPDDQFIQVKINGKFESISVKEAGEGYQLKRASHQRMTHARDAVKQAEAIVKQAREERQMTARTLKNVFGGDTVDDLVNFMERNFPGKAMEVARYMANRQYRLDQMSPEDRAEEIARQKVAQREYQLKKQQERLEQQQSQANAQRIQEMTAKIGQQAWLEATESLDFDMTEITDQMRKYIKGRLVGVKPDIELYKQVMSEAIKLHRHDNPKQPKQAPRVAKRRKASVPQPKKKDGVTTSYRDFWKSLGE